MSSANPSERGPSDQLSVLIVGCGAIAGGYDAGRHQAENAPMLVLTHAQAYCAHPDFRLTACVEPDTARRTAFMERWGVPEGFPKLEDCCGRAFDVASVCVPTAAHGAVLQALLNLPVKAVFCEKPLTDDLDEGRRLAAAYDAAGRFLMVNYPRRWDPEMVALRDEIAGGTWGALQAATANYGKGILNNGGHVLDLLQFLLGPLTPRAASRPCVDWDAADPTLDALLEAGNGAPVRLIGTDRRLYSLLELDLILEEGRVSVEDGGFRVRRRHARPDPRFAGYRTLGEDEVRQTGYGQALAHAVDTLHRLLRHATPRPGMVETALSAQAIGTELIRLSRMASTTEAAP